MAVISALCMLLHAADHSPAHKTQDLCAGDGDQVDALEDDSPGNIFLWELRQLTSLAKENRKAAGEHKKGAKQVLGVGRVL